MGDKLLLQSDRASQDAQPLGSKPSAQARIAILLVEDEPLVAMALEDMLDEIGYAISGMADTGNAALDLAAERRPTLALVDIGLPGALDGIETARLLRERYQISTIFMTGTGDSAVLSRAENVGCAGILSKPYDVRQLKAILDQALSQG